MDDCAAVARWLAERGRVDGARMAIRGQSAGGLTALNALVRTELFAAAVSWYGVTDLMRLAETTHDFESRYTDRLIGPLPEAADRYTERSPLRRVDEMTGAVLLLQGEDDPIVPPEPGPLDMAAALQARGVRCECDSSPASPTGSAAPRPSWPPSRPSWPSTRGPARGAEVGPSEPTDPASTLGRR